MLLVRLREAPNRQPFHCRELVAAGAGTQLLKGFGGGGETNTLVGSQSPHVAHVWLRCAAHMSFLITHNLHGLPCILLVRTFGHRGSQSHLR
eukprot:351773-Chlamydomonas_euryale.AAC.20